MKRKIKFKLESSIDQRRKRFRKTNQTNAYEFRSSEGGYIGIPQIDEAIWIENRTREKDPPNNYDMLE